MVQADGFFAYATGAALALCVRRSAYPRHTVHAGRDAEGARPPVHARRDAEGARGGAHHFAVALAYFALLFVPCELWLLWRFPGWETMYAGITMTGWPTALFAASLLVLGMLGFTVTRRLVRRGRTRLALVQGAASCSLFVFVMVHGWDGSGYQRFLETDPRVFHRWGEADDVLDHVWLWLGTELALTLGIMAVVAGTTGLVIGSRWFAGTDGRPPKGTWGVRGGRRSSTLFALSLGGTLTALAVAWAAIAFCLFNLFGGALGGAVAAVVFLVTTVPRRGVLAHLARRLDPETRAEGAKPEA
ncbi:hypothetical protein ACIQM4_26140 [Streptomyces sp. NPDC091272]|uniref:hypothetical protein n=1 Tax=Streptomyces sp. NPDC091272 TaxID=3365981 RepID=UPI00380ABA24